MQGIVERLPIQASLYLVFSLWNDFIKYLIINRLQINLLIINIPINRYIFAQKDMNFIIKSELCQIVSI